MRNIIFTIVFTAICSISVFAYNHYDFYAVCESGQTLYYTITSNSSPYAVMVTYPDSDDYYYGYTKPTGNLVIPASVTYNNVEYSVTRIGDDAFYECNGLTSVTIPNSVTYIGGFAFDGTGWYNNQSNGILYLCNWCLGYKGNKPTGELTINEGTRGIAGYTFKDCSSLTSVTISNSVTTIGECAFSGCSGLADVTLGNSLAYIGQLAFSGCSGLTSITIPNSVTDISSYAFSNCSGLTSVIIPNSVTYIGSEAFRNCTGLTSVTIGDGVTSIYNSAFKGCSGLTTVNYNATNCTRMGSESYPVFANCSSFTLNIGANVAIIPENAFKGCSSFTSIVSRATNPPAIYSSSFDSSLSPMTPLTVPCGTTAEYQRYWYYFRNIQEDCTDVSDDYLSELSIFPNPATDILNITSSENISEIEIVNTLGQVVYRQDANADSVVCNVEDLKAGVYFVKIYGNPRTSTGSVSGIVQKFIKE